MRYFCFFLILLLASCGPSLPDDVALAYSELPKTIDYNIHVKPILSDRCFACHGNDKNKLKASLRLDNAEDAYSFLKDSKTERAIVPGSLEKSAVFHRIVSDDEELVMPPPESNLELEAKEIAILTKWIKQGGKFKDHWAFILPESKTPTRYKQKEWINNDIDKFILSELEARSWKPSEEADKLTLLRRLSFDLTGLPPTIAEIEAFQNDKSDTAYEEVVDRLLASNAYGERMAVDWMDVSRFADTHGYTVDRERDMSPWRDWVIKAFNENMSYKQFVTWQLAGDLLPNASREQILATGFNRNHQQNMEGGIIPEEFRVEYVADRTNTLGVAFLGLTVECARCHDHKYDPISQKEYFELFSFFNNVNEAGQISFDNAMPVPTILLSDEETESIIEFIDKQVTSTLEDFNNDGFEKWISSRPEVDVEYNKPIAHLDFESNLGIATIKQQHSSAIRPIFENGSIVLDGDSWVDLGSIGAFNKDQAFTIRVSLNIPSELQNGVIFHKGDGAAIYNFRGFHLAIKDGKLEALMARTTPDNAIIKRGDDLPRDKWIELTMTYDGSSTAEGLKVYLDGVQFKLETKVDNLYKDILFDRAKEKGLQIGARWRGVGLKGGRIDDFKVYDSELSEIEIGGITSPSKDQLRSYFDLNIDPKAKERRKKIYDLRRKKTETIDTIQELMVMKEMERPRQAYILERGIYDNYGEKVFPSTIEAILPFSDDLPRNRLGLAEWLFDEKNPLTARVTVNRIWQQFFGIGLVKSTNDFGNQGNLPSHLELLDYLALSFMKSSWDVKALVKEIVMSSTYRQSSVLRDDMVEVDSENIYLWRGPSQRLSAEMMRDNVLAASGLLVDKIGGPSVKPYQPKGLWAINGGKYQRDYGENLYRKSLYTFWKRSVPNPTQAIFDAPNRSSCSVSRQKTSTPLQALVLMNDPAYQEAAKVLGEEISKTENIELSISKAFAKLTGRYPSENEIKLLVDIREEEYKKFVSFPEKLEGWLDAGDYKISANRNVAEIAANTVLASTLINADATIIKR